MNNAPPDPAAAVLPEPPISVANGDLRARPLLRRQLRERRRRLTAAEQHHAAGALARRLGRDTLFRRSRHIAFYLANDGELSLLPLLDRAARMRKHCYLPVVMPDGRLRFAPYRPGDTLAPNVYGIPEPARAGLRLVDARLLDLVLMPLVAFDAAGNRLGMGGGFYDRSLSYLRHRRHWRKPRLLGIAHEFQRVPALAPQWWDVALDGIATDAATYTAAR